MADVTVRGYAVLWDELSVNLGGFRERFRRGAFSDSLADGEVKFMVRSHDMARPVASTSSRTLELAEDVVGLRFKATLPDTGDAGDLASTVKRKVLNKMSFAFSTERASDEMFTEENGELIRTIKRAHLFEVSPVTFPAYPQTSIRSSATADQNSDELATPKRNTKGKRKSLMQRRQTAAEANLTASKPKPKPQRPEALRMRQERLEREQASRSRR